MANTIIGALMVTILCLGLGTWFIQSTLTQDAKQEVNAALTTVRDTTHLALKMWIKDHKAAATTWANSPAIQQSATALLNLAPEKSALTHSEIQSTLREWFRPIQKATGYQGYYIVGPNFINLASSRDQHIGARNLLLSQQGFLQTIWSGESKVSLPVLSDISLSPHQSNISMFVACPIYGNSGETVAVFMFRLDPAEGFTSLLQRGRIGTTGETYAFDSKARLISESRFDEQLLELGLIPPGKSAILNIELRDPGENLVKEGKAQTFSPNTPLTLMASSAIKQGTGENLMGYRDYRGVPVVGAWLWDDELNFGIATELDMEEAFNSLYDAQLALKAFTALLLAVVFGTTVIAILLRQRNQAVKSSQTEKEKLRLHLDTANTIIIALDPQGKITLINKTACVALGYEEAELIGQEWFSICIPEKEYHDVYHTYLALMSGEIKNHDYYENSVLTRTGESRWIAWHNTVLKDKQGTITGTLSAGHDITEKRQLEEELKRAAIVFDNTEEGIIVTNADTDILLVNNAFSKITGYTLDEIRGISPRFMGSGKQDNDFYQAMYDTLESKGHWSGELWNRRKNGEVYPVWENINTVKNDQGIITNYVAILSDISELKRAEERLNYLAHHDALTALPNRLHFLSNLEQAIEGAKRHQRKVALLFLDLDKFKYINDTLGHSAGDLLLQEVASRLKDCVRAEDTVARMGGDEFTIILMEVTHSEDAGLIADKIVKSISQPISIYGELIQPSTSVGISLFPNDAEDSDSLLKAADTAMYNAKALGRNNFQFFTTELAQRSVEHALIEKGLRKALENSEFELYYQPQIRLADGMVEGVEALIRWNHPERGLMLPEGFIRIADDSDLIDDICEWVLRSTLRDLKNWSLKHGKCPRVAVNLTARQAANKNSLLRILRVIEELNPAPHKLQIDFEVSEAAIHHIENKADIINRLKELGVMIAVSDFGKGVSSLTLIRQLPIDTLKINQGLIQHLEHEDNERSVASAIIAMAHSLGIRVIGEGVQTKWQLETLKQLSCDEIQGFYCCKPLQAHEIEPLLQKSLL